LEPLFYFRQNGQLIGKQGIPSPSDWVVSLLVCLEVFQSNFTTALTASYASFLKTFPQYQILTAF